MTLLLTLLYSVYSLINETSSKYYEWINYCETFLLVLLYVITHTNLKHLLKSDNENNKLSMNTYDTDMGR